MIVAEWMTRQLVTVTPRTTLGEAAAEMARRRLRHLPVVEDDGRLAGVVTKSDLLRACPPDLNPFSVETADAPVLNRPVREVMSARPVTTAPDAPLEDAARVLSERKVGALVVVSAGRLVGIITDSDIFRAFVAAFGGTEPGARVTFEIASGDDPVRLSVELAASHSLTVSSVVSFSRDGRRVAVVRFSGGNTAALVDDLWTRGHAVISVRRVG